MTARILVVEDDRDIAEFVAHNLRAAGFETALVHAGDLALGAVREHQPALVVLDVMLPGLDGLEVTRRIRERSDVPILLLTAKRGEADKILGFELGADDYLTKPFSPRELLARVRALLRRSSPSSVREVIEVGALRIDAGRRHVEREGTPVETTTLEFDLLHFLASRPGRVYTREALMTQVWGEDRVVDARSIDSLVSRLRRKLEADPRHPRYVQTVWGSGYRFGEES
jgi:DNA-binding response OmpR family regulator